MRHTECEATQHFRSYLGHEIMWIVTTAALAVLTIRRYVLAGHRNGNTRSEGETAPSMPVVENEPVTNDDEEKKEEAFEKFLKRHICLPDYEEIVRRVLRENEAQKREDARKKSQMLLLQQEKRSEEIEERKKKLVKVETIRATSTKVSSGFEEEKEAQENFEIEMAKKRNMHNVVEVWSRRTLATKEVGGEERERLLKNIVADKWKLKLAEKKKIEENNKMLIEKQKAAEEEKVNKRRVHVQVAANKWMIKTAERKQAEDKIDVEIASRAAEEQRTRERVVVELDVAEERNKRRQREWVEEERKKEWARIASQGREDKSGDTKRTQPQSDGKQTVLTVEQAMEPCKQLGEGQLLSKLNIALHTQHSVNTIEGLTEALRYCISHDYDFGTAYALLRNGWERLGDAHSSLTDRLAVEEIDNRRRKGDRDMLKSDEDGHLAIIDPVTVKPRRIWDLLAHRVVPYDSVDAFKTKKPWAISHSWVADIETVMTSVNGFEWPVPLPKDVTLEAVRDELLDAGAEYCWLDILCLRQVSDSKSFEHLRSLEWEIDVPTIGNAYLGNGKVVRYYNGLGRPFETSGWGDVHHWSNRAWTLQEFKSESIVGGVANPAGLPTRKIADGRFSGQSMKQYEAHWDSISKLLEYRTPTTPHSGLNENPNRAIRTTCCGFFGLLKEMRERYASNEVDKVAGIGFLMLPASLPAFSERTTPEEAWTRCVHHMSSAMRDELLFRFPAPGDGGHSWFPSWKQIQDKRYVLPEDRPGSLDDISDRRSGLTNHVRRSATSYTYFGHLIEKGHLVAQPTGDRIDGPRRWAVTVEHGGRKLKFFVSARHHVEIPDGEYSLVGRVGSKDFIVCRYDETATVPGLQKVSVVSMDSDKVDQSILLNKPCRFV